MTTEVHWNRLTAAELNDRAKSDAIVLLPVASVEQHGPHLGTGVDMFLAAEGCRRTAEIVAKQRAIVVAPTVWMGLAEHHVAYGGTFTLSITTYHALLRDLCRSILRAGFKKVLIVNGHGGNIAALNALATDLAQELAAPIAVTTLYNLAHEAGAYKKILEDQDGVRHACEAETSMMMVTAPDCVRKDKIKDAHGAFTATRGLGVTAPINLWRSFKEVTPSGVIGDARKATPEKGEKLFDAAAELLAAELLKGVPWA